MTKSFARVILVACLPLFLLQCGRNVRTYSGLEIHIPEGINISEGELKGRLDNPFLHSGGLYTLRVTVYGYSPGAEIISISGAEKFSRSRGRAWIKGLVQVRSNNTIAAARLVEVTADGREELLDSFCSEIWRIVNSGGL